jgi:tRNA(fMet)-specific endonuclease VapC
VTLRFLLDTSIVSAPMAKVPSHDLVARLEAHSDTCAIAAPVLHELVVGCQRLPRGNRRLAFERYLHEVVLAAFPVLPYDAMAAEWHGRERARLERLSRPAPFVDGQIAAIARVHDLVLVTASVKDFAPFQELVVQDWSERGG